MKELDNSARVWRVFNDESERTDAEMVGGWIGTLNTLFIFAGLFSAVVSTFLTQTSQSLHQDYSAVMASLLTEMVSLQRATATGGNISAISRSDLTYNSTFTSSSRDVWLNSLWLASLSLTLLVALMAGLIKQWLHYYLADIIGVTPKVRACTRQFRYRGLVQWGVPPIIELLPVLMNTSLLLFFIGLVLFTRDLSGMVGISWFLVGLTAISFAVYVGSSFIPVLKPQCPYKTSLSKVYNGLIKVVWYLTKCSSLEQVKQEPLSALSARNDGRSWFRRCSVQLKKWITKLSSLGTSLRMAESEVVDNNGFELMQDVITEMGLSSTNPSVSAIALQSLAAFHIHQVSVQLPDSLIKELRDLFCGCFRRDSSKRWGYSIASDISVAERYSRAMLLFPDHIGQVDYDWHQLLSFSPPENLHTATLLASAKRLMNHETMWKGMTDMQFILDAPPIEAFTLTPWAHHQFIGAIDAAVSSYLYSPDEQKQLLVALVERLSPNKALTLQEDVLIHYLFSSRAKAGRIEPLKEQTLTEEGNQEMSDDVKKRSQATLIRYIRLLPNIYDCALLLGSEEQEQLLLYLLAMGFWGVAVGICINWNEESMVLINDHPEFSSSVNSLTKLLNQLASSQQKWDGNVLIHLRVITELHNALRYHGKCDKEVVYALFHWLLVISLQGQACPGDANPIEQAMTEHELLQSLFPDTDLFTQIPNDWFGDSLMTLCDFIELKQLLGLPPVLIGHLLGQLEYLLKNSIELTVLDCLDRLFHHFLQQDPLCVDSEYPMACDAQQTTINQLIRFACKQHSQSTRWNVMLISWHQLVDEMKVEPTWIGNEFDTSRVAPSMTCDWMDMIDLQDVMQIFEVGNTRTWNDDPWDLEEVFGMFEDANPLGASLNLKWPKQQLDKSLGSQGCGVEDCHVGSDVTQLFEGASKDPFPLTNDQYSKLH